MPLTDDLVAFEPTRAAYAAATRHPFLRAAGQRTLSSTQLAAWLTQDRLYALCGYGAFLGMLISKIPASESGPDDVRSKQHRRRLTVLAGAMANIDREVGFFERVAHDNGLDLATLSLSVVAEKSTQQKSETGPGLANPITRGYIDYMVAVASRGTFEEGLVLLWAMEKLYLDAWTFAASFVPRDIANSSIARKVGAESALLELIPNWSAPAFAQFVEDIAELVDELGIEVGSSVEGNASGHRILEVWKTTLWYEERFWRAGGEIANA